MCVCCGNFEHMLCEHMLTQIMSRFRFWLFSPWSRQLSSLCSKTPIIHLWHDSILTSLQEKLFLPSLHLSIFSFFSVSTPPLHISPLDWFLFFSLVSFSFFQLHFFPLNLLFSENFYLGLMALEKERREKNEMIAQNYC